MTLTIFLDNDHLSHTITLHSILKSKRNFKHMLYNKTNTTC